MKFLFTNNQSYIAYGLVPGLIQIGEAAEIVPLWHYPMENQAEVLMRKIDEYQPDYIFTESDPPNYNLEAVLEVCSTKGIPVIYWATEDPLWFKEISCYRAKRADYLFTTSEELLDEYRLINKNSHLLLFGCNPEFHQRLPIVPEYQYDIIFVGSNYQDRVEANRLIIEPLIQKKYHLKIWGNWWVDRNYPYQIPGEYYGGVLPYNFLPQVYSSAKIVLGLHLDGTSKTQTSVRSYEVLGCGAFYLTQYTQAHANLFRKGVHLDWVTNEVELLELVDFYLANDAVRKNIALTGQEYVYANHTFAHRARELVAALR